MTLDELKLVRTLMGRLSLEVETVPDEMLFDLAAISALCAPALFSEIEDRKDGMSSYREDSSL